jgi:hypothetical protein
MGKHVVLIKFAEKKNNYLPCQAMKKKLISKNSKARRIGIRFHFVSDQNSQA